MGIPKEQSPPPALTSGRGNPDNAAITPLRRWVRFKDLRAAGIISNWPTLLRLIEDEGFPGGRMIAPNTRAWLASEIEAWLESRPKPRSRSLLRTMKLPGEEGEKSESSPETAESQSLKSGHD